MKGHAPQWKSLKKKERKPRESERGRGARGRGAGRGRGRGGMGYESTRDHSVPPAADDSWNAPPVSDWSTPANDSWDTPEVTVTAPVVAEKSTTDDWADNADSWNNPVVAPSAAVVDEWAQPAGSGWGEDLVETKPVKAKPVPAKPVVKRAPPSSWAQLLKE